MQLVWWVVTWTVNYLNFACYLQFGALFLGDVDFKDGWNALKLMGFSWIQLGDTMNIRD